MGADSQIGKYSVNGVNAERSQNVFYVEEIIVNHRNTAEARKPFIKHSDCLRVSVNRNQPPAVKLGSYRARMAASARRAVNINAARLNAK